MHFSRLALVAVLATAARAQTGNIASDQAQIPACAQSCLTTAIGASGCGATDYACQCTTGHAAILSSASPCILTACSSSDAILTQNLTNDICAVVSSSGSAAPASTSASSSAAGGSTSASATSSAASSVASSVASSASSASSAASVASSSAASKTTSAAGSSSVAGSSAASSAASKTSSAPATVSSGVGSRLQAGAGIIGAAVVAAIVL